MDNDVPIDDVPIEGMVFSDLLEVEAQYGAAYCR